MATEVNHEQVEEFRREIAEMRLKDPAVARDRRFAVAGAVMMAVGVATAGIAYLLTHSTTNPAEQRDYVVSALVGIAVTLAGGFLFLRGSLAQFLRFWLARLIYEQRMAADRIVESR